MRTVFLTAGMLVISNIFMTYAWYGHLKNLRNKPLIIAIILSWLVALMEYAVQVPANRIGNNVLNLGQLKILQETIALGVFIPFALLYMKEKLTWNYYAAGFCILIAVFLIFIPVKH